MLSNYRILDLTDDRGLIAGMILADLGADVIQVEPPDGSPARRVGPFAHGTPDLENSLFWLAYARNKRGITLDLESDKGKADFIRLVAGADCVLESFSPGYLSGLGLGYEDLARVNPGLVLTSITAFGQTGPKAFWPATDLTVMSASGFQFICGDEDRAPLRMTVPQAFLHAAANGALGTLIALQERRHSGRGQHVDVSAQQTTSLCAIANMMAKAWGDEQMTRVAGGVKVGPLHLPFTYPAKDGYVSITFSFGSAMGPATRRLMEWIFEEGMCDQETRDKDWIGYGELLLSGKEPLSELKRVAETIARFTATKTKSELFEGAQRRGVLLSIVATMADVRHDHHLEARGFWVPASPSEQSVLYPGPFAKLAASPISFRRRAPRLGEHNEEILEQAPQRQSPQGVVPPTNTPAMRPLEGLKVVDLSWVLVGPSSTRMLSDYGATVVRIESSKRVDNLRTLRPMKDGQFGVERGGMYYSVNAGKLGLTLDLSKPEAREIVKRLAQWADVLVESFTPKVMKNWGLDYSVLRELNPRLIYAATCMGGQWGPYSLFAGYGGQGAAMAGFNNLYGWTDRPPAGPAGPYTDYVVPPFITSAILAALEHRERTGLGQLIDIAQIEVPLHFLAPALLDYEVNGNITQASGNRDPHMAPHGVFRCSGEERWVAIAVQNDEQWRAICAAMDRPDLVRDARFGTLEGRQSHEDEIEQQIGDWTQGLSAEAVQQQLIARGVPAHIVSDGNDLYDDPQLRHRGHYVTATQRELGEVVLENSRFTLTRTPAEVNRPGPSYGQDTFYVLTSILKLSDEEVADLAEAGALE